MKKENNFLFGVKEDFPLTPQYIETQIIQLFKEISNILERTVGSLNPEIYKHLKLKFSISSPLETEIHIMYHSESIKDFISDERDVRRQELETSNIMIVMLNPDKNLIEIEVDEYGKEEILHTMNIFEVKKSDIESIINVDVEQVLERFIDKAQKYYGQVVKDRKIA